MILVIDRALDAHDATALRNAAEALGYQDGRNTAGWHAREVKRNQQAIASPERADILEKVRAVLAQNDLVQSAARPRRFARLALARYDVGMEYGFHVDDAIIDGSRTDVSFTLCLSAAGDYEGGELEIDDSLEQRAVHLDAGQMILYPSNTLHRVAPVTAGNRLVIIGWITSWVADPVRRGILFDLDRTTGELLEAGATGTPLNRLQRVRSNLFRMWADG
jgi:PKHD-type hydroxylase